MANVISNHKANTPALIMTNGQTTVIMCVLAFSASELAKTDWEKQFAKWISTQDQNIYGRGMVGFDVSEIGWSKADFTEQKRSVHAVIDKALTKYRWDVLPFNFQYAEEDLSEIRKLVELFQLEFIEKDGRWARAEEVAPPFELCEIHHVYRHLNGCIICNASEGIIR